ncbi:MAG: glycosyltransferase family 2 protein [Saprospiraceae bacterium]|nr:glycosyltransferase family 2 protein [Saprospiraceae bacterium]HQW70593.1 glycosyltransferase family 2 protein [Saprospiraceae bacterium]
MQSQNIRSSCKECLDSFFKNTKSISHKKIMIDVSVVIVSWNVCRYLDECIESLHQCAEVNFTYDKESNDKKYLGEIIVIDSNSSDNTLEMLNKYPNVIVIPQKNNIGYLKGNNLGAKIAKGEFLFILNPDTLVYPKTISTMINYMRGDKSLGGCSPWISNAEGYVQIPKKFPSLGGVAFCLPIFKKYPKKFLEKETLLRMPLGDFTLVEWIDGCSIFTRKEIFELINGFDEDFTMFAEEKDLCMRMKKAGWGKMIVVHDAKLLHYGGRSTENNQIVKHVDYWFGDLLYFRKHHSKLETQILKISILLCYTWLCFVIQFGISKRFGKDYFDIFLKTIKIVSEFKINV